MATNLVADGNVLDVTAGGAVASGSVQVAGDTVGVALTAASGSGVVYTLAIEGVFTVPKTTGTAWAQGDSLDWDASAGEFTKDIAVPASGDVENCGIAYAAAASGAATGQVKLTPGTGTVT